MDLLRFAAVGSVDDGKSTLIGRLLFDTRQLFDDQMEAVTAASQRRGVGEVDLSFVTDGLRAEREQGITIDVAYRYAATPRRKFVIADCPGHVQYTRNMATGASTADLALVVVDATAGPAGADPAPRLHRRPARRGPVHRLRQQDGPGRLGRGRLRAGRPRRWATLARRLGVTSATRHPGLGPPRRQRGRALRRRALVHGPDGARGAGVGAGRRLGRGPRHRTGAPAPACPVQWVLRHPGGGRSYAGMVNGGPAAARRRGGRAPRRAATPR